MVRRFELRQPESRFVRTESGPDLWIKPALASRVTRREFARLLPDASILQEFRALPMPGR